MILVYTSVLYRIGVLFSKHFRNLTLYVIDRSCTYDDYKYLWQMYLHMLKEQVISLLTLLMSVCEDKKDI